MSTAVKVILIVVGVFVLLVVGCVGMLFMGFNEGSNAQEDFYNAVLEGDVDAVHARFHPALQTKIDKPLLAAWMAAVKERLGAFTGMSANGLSFNVSNTNGHKSVESSGTAEFEKGTADSKLKLVDGKIVEWSTDSEAMKENWFTALEDASFYDAKAQVFLKAVLAADGAKALGLVPEGLRKMLADDGFADKLDGLKAYYAPATGITLNRHAFDAGPPQKLIMRYQAVGMPVGPDGKPGDELMVTWSFRQMQGVIQSFHLPMK